MVFYSCAISQLSAKSRGRGRVPASHVHKGASNRGTPLDGTPVISSWSYPGPRDGGAGSSIAIDFLAHLRPR